MEKKINRKSFRLLRVLGFLLRGAEAFSKKCSPDHSVTSLCKRVGVAFRQGKNFFVELQKARQVNLGLGVPLKTLTSINVLTAIADVNAVARQILSGFGRETAHFGNIFFSLDKALAWLSESRNSNECEAPSSQKDFTVASEAVEKTKKFMKKVKKEARERKSFRLAFWGAVNRGLSVYYQKKIVCPSKKWLAFDAEPVKIAKFVFNAPLSIVLKNPLPPGDYDLSDYLPPVVLDDIYGGNLELAVVLSQLKRCMPKLPSGEVQEATQKHMDCVTKPIKDAPELHLAWIEKITEWVFGSLRRVDWTVKDSDFSESASFDTIRLFGGGKKSLFCGPNCKSGGGKYHDREKVWKRFMTEDITPARVCGVNTNMKVRIITAHSAECNFFRSLQQVLHNRLRKIPVFSFTGGMPSMAALDHFSPSEGYVFNSADYSCATDGINPESTRTALKQIFRMIKPPSDLNAEEWKKYKENASLTLTSALLRYFPKTPLQVDIRQNYGQMMGHLLSFPLLNIVNAAIWAETMYKYEDYTMDDLYMIFTGQHDTTLRINGDDLLTKMRESTVPFFAETVRKNGWELSVGKSYVHRTVGCINSMFFDFKNKQPVAETYKFGGLAKDADKEAFAMWLWERRGAQGFFNVFEFCNFYKDWIRGTFCHPSVFNFFLYFPPEEQAILSHLFGTPRMSDYLKWRHRQNVEARRLAVEAEIEVSFRKLYPEVLTSEEQTLHEYSLACADSEELVCSKGNRLFSFLKFCSSDSPVSVRFPELESVTNGDELFWDYVGKWRRDRLAVEEYEEGAEKERGIFNKFRFLKRFEKKRMFRSWLTRQSSYQQWLPNSRGRFLYRRSLYEDDIFLKIAEGLRGGSKSDRKLPTRPIEYESCSTSVNPSDVPNSELYEAMFPKEAETNRSKRVPNVWVTPPSESEKVLRRKLDAPLASN